MVSQALLARPVSVGASAAPCARRAHGPAEQAETVDVRNSSFILEIYFKTEPGAGKAVLIKKMDDRAGYALTVDGAATFATKSGGSEVSVTGKAVVNDGKWHHVLAEADRKAGHMTIYVDGKKDVEGAGPAAGSLANGADFYVGGTPAATAWPARSTSRWSASARWPTPGRPSANSTPGSSTARSCGTSPATPSRQARDAGALEFQPGD